MFMGGFLLWGTGRQSFSGPSAEVNALVSFPLWTFIEISVFFCPLLMDFSNFRAKYTKSHVQQPVCHHQNCSLNEIIIATLYKIAWVWYSVSHVYIKKNYIYKSTTYWQCSRRKLKLQALTFYFLVASQNEKFLLMFRWLHSVSFAT